jgi:ceramide glucosyltransferase
VIATALGAAILAWSHAVTCTSVYGVARAAWKRARRQTRRGERAEEHGDRPAKALGAMRALVVRPCAGLEAGLDRALASLAGARSSARLACRFAIESEDDPAVEPARRASERLRSAGIDAAVMITHADGPNRKAAQIDAVLRSSRHLSSRDLSSRDSTSLDSTTEKGSFDAVVIADSDVDLEGFDLDALLAPLAAGGSAGAVWAPPVEVGALGGSGDRASRALLSGSLHAFVLLGALDGGGLVGKLFAVSADALRAAGGFAALTRVLGEDMELALRLRRAGRRVEVAPVVARSLKSGRSWGSAVERYARWLAVIRAQRPALLASYPLLFLATPFVVIAAALLCALAPQAAGGATARWLAIAAIALALGSRWLVAIAARALAGRGFSPLGSIADAALADALLACAFLRCLATRTLTWRGRALTLDRGGSLSGDTA